MSKADTPWGFEDLILNTTLSIEGDASVAMKQLALDSQEMTPVTTHSDATVLLYVQDGAIDLQVRDDFYELEPGDGHVIQPGERHQIENLNDSVTTVLAILVPWDPEDEDIIEDPYSR